MATIDWPATLRGAIQNTKTITQAAGFIESDPAAGASYTQFFTDDQPTFISFDLRFSRAEAPYFDAWARNNGVFSQGTFFNFPIYDEYGLTEQEVRFISSGKPSYSENGLIRGYSGCRIIAPNYIRPDAESIQFLYDEYGIANVATELSYLDLTINQEWPVV